MAKRYLVLAVAFFVLEALLMAFVDLPLSQYLRALDQTHHGLIDFFRAWTNLGLSKWYLWPSGIGAIICLALSPGELQPPPRREKFKTIGVKLAFLFACVAVSGIVADIVKAALGRSRPVLFDRQGLYDFEPFTFHAAHQSMPSGHATTAFTLAMALTILFPRGWPWFFAYAVALAASRVMVNAHYLSDTLAGAAVAVLTVTAVYKIFRGKGLFGNSPD